MLCSISVHAWAYCFAAVVSYHRVYTIMYTIYVDCMILYCTSQYIYNACHYKHTCTRAHAHTHTGVMGSRAAQRHVVPVMGIVEHDGPEANGHPQPPAANAVSDVYVYVMCIQPAELSWELYLLICH